MDKATPNPSNQSTAPRRQMDFVANKSNKSSQSAEPANPAPTPVTSAKAAINAMYAERARKTEPILTPSAREAVNASARLGAGRNAKSAANLHHGSIQKDIDTSRTSAAALLPRAKSPQPSVTETRPTDSYDPLASSRLHLAQSEPKPADSEQEIPVIRTSLKLGAAAKAKPAPVVLPPNARMARGARPIGGAKRAAKSGLLSHRSTDIQIIQPNTVNPGQHTKKLPQPPKALPAKDDDTLKVQFLSSNKPKSLPAKAPTQLVKSAPKMPTPARAMRPATPARDPQMLGGATSRPAARSKAAPLWPAAATSALGPKPKFRPAPKGYASTTPTGVAPDNSYVITTPPRLNPVHNHAPIVPSGPAARPLPSLKADNTSDYSFSTKNKPVEHTRHAAANESPFLKSVTVEKRPLSDNAAPSYTKIPRPVVEEKASKSSRKNVYAKKNKSKSDARQELPQRPTVIVPSSRRSKVPLFFLILFTIILGAVVGAAAYLCFFQ